MQEITATYESGADIGLLEFVGLLEVGEGVVLQLRLAVENGGVGRRRKEGVAKLALLCEHSGVGHVVGELAASLVEVLALGVRKERLFVSSSGAVGDRSTRIEVRSLSHSTWEKKKMELTGMGGRGGVLWRSW